MSQKVKDAKALSRHLEHTLNQMHRQWAPLQEYLVGHEDRKWDESGHGEDLTEFALRILRERDEDIHGEKTFVMVGGKTHMAGDTIYHNAPVNLTWGLRWAILTGTVMHCDGTIYTKHRVHTLASKITITVESFFDRFKRKPKGGLVTSEPLSSNMKYEYQRLADNKVIGLAINLGPGEQAKDVAPLIKAEDFPSWLQEVKTASRTLAAPEEGGTPLDIVEVQITHPNGSIQEMSFDDAKTFLVRE